MIGLLNSKVLVAAGAVAGIILSSLLWITYNHFIGHPRVANEARLGYVVLSEKAAIEAKLKLEEKRRKAAEEISSRHQALLKIANAEAEAEQARLEQENADYEARLEAAGRSCRLDDADIEWLRKP